MVNLKRTLQSLVYFIIPFLQVYKIKIQLDSEIETLGNLDDKKSVKLSYMKGYEKLSIDDLEKILEQTSELKKILEDKAKMNIFVITVSSSLVIGFSKFMIELNSNMTFSSSINWILFLLISFTLIYFIIGALTSIKVIIDLNQHNFLFPEQYSLPENKKKKLIALNTEINVKRNINRNNFINASYKSIRNSLICLIIFFILTTIPIYNYKGSVIDDIKNKQDVIEVQLNDLQSKNINIQKEITALTNKDNNNKKLIDELYIKTNNLQKNYEEILTKIKKNNNDNQ